MRHDGSFREKRHREWDHQNDRGRGGQWSPNKRGGDRYGGGDLTGPPQGVIDILTNAVSLNIDSRVFEKLYVISVKFESSSRVLSFKDDRLKGFLINNKEIKQHLPEFGCFLDYRDEAGMKIFAAQVKGGPSISDMLSAIPSDGVEVLIKSRKGGDETWRVTLQQEKGSPLNSPADNITQFMQFTNHVAKQIITTLAGFTMLNGDSRMVKMDPRAHGVKELRCGMLIPGYLKNITCLQNGQIIWTFKPQYTLMLNTDFQQYMEEFKPSVNSASELSSLLSKKRLTLSTCYRPSNLYRFLKIVEDVKLTDTFEVTISKNDQLIKKTMTRLEYFRTTYPKDSKVMSYPRIENAEMVGVAIITGKQSRGKSGRMVFIPAPFLNVTNVPSSSLSTNVRMEITKCSQKKATESFADIKNVCEELNTPIICDEFKKYGFDFDPKIVKIQGNNNVTNIINIQGADGRIRLTYDDQCSFMRDFTRAEHAAPPRINEWMFLAKKDYGGNFPHRIAENLMNDLVSTAEKKGWEWRYNSFSSGWIVSFETLEDIDREVANILPLFKTRPRPDVIIGLIPQKDDHDYSCVKRFAYRLGCPSQVITQDLVKRLGSKAFWKVLSGLCGKLMPKSTGPGTVPLHSHPWRLRDPPTTEFDQIPHYDGGRGSTSTICMAISTYKQSQQARDSGGLMGWGITATTTEDCVGLIQDFGELVAGDQSLFARLDVILEPIFRRLYYGFQRNCQNLIIYRRGISEGLLSRLLLTEIPAVRKALKAILGSQEYFDDDHKLVIIWPERLKENGQYEIEVPCISKSTGKKTTELLQTNLERFVNDAGRKTAALNIIIPEDLQVDGQYSVRIKAPSSKTFVTMPPKPRICYIVTNRSSTTSLLAFNARQSRGRDPMLMPGGTVINTPNVKAIPRFSDTQDEFYIVPGTGPMGFAAPVHYIIVQNELGISTSTISDITLKLSFMYYNHQGSNKTPHIVRIAEAASEQALTVYRGIQKEAEADQKLVNKIVIQAEVDRLKDSAIFL